jgi:hypothetical protein
VNVDCLYVELVNVARLLRNLTVPGVSVQGSHLDVISEQSEFLKVLDFTLTHISSFETVLIPPQCVEADGWDSVPF